MRVLPFWGVRWLTRRRNRHRRDATPLASDALRALAPFFPPETLAAARVAIVPRLSISRLLGLARRLGLPAVDMERILGITFLDTIVVPQSRADPLSVTTLFHELVHVEQARQLGVRGFVERYVRGWLAAERSYAAIPLEADAYALERRFRAAPDEPFDVGAEVARRLAEPGSLDPTGHPVGALRKATLADRPALAELIGESARGLGRADYTARQIESAIETGVFGVDTDLIRDGTYFVVESEGRLIGCGGWSRRRTLFGGDRFGAREAEELDPRTEPAKIRAFFVHPRWSRRGIARRILERCESEARAHGFRALEMMATLPGIRLYRALGYVEGERREYEMEDGVSIELVPMQKPLDERA